MPVLKKQSEDCLFVIDAGTQSIRAAIIDLKGTILEIVKTPIEPYYSIKPGWAEQDPDYYWKVLCRTSQALLQKKTVDKQSIRGVSLTTQRATTINVDKNGKALRPAIIWLDQRKAELESWPPFHLKLGLKVINMHGSVVHAYRESEANWIRQNQQDIWRDTHKFLFLSGFFTHRLTGSFVDSIGNMVGYVPFDYKNHRWFEDSNWRWKLFGVERSKLPDLVMPSQQLGVITRQAATATGIPAGLPVIAGAADKACEVLGSGCLTPEIACLSYGTTATIETTNEKYVEVVPFFSPYPSAVPGSFNTEVMIFRGYWMVSWFKKEFGMREELIAKKRNISPEALFDELVRAIPPGSMGLTLQPYWSPGVKVPGPEAKGSIIGFGDVHTRAHIYRAILEGLAYALKEGAQKTQLRNKIHIEKIRVSGGGSQSKVAMQLTADIFNLTAEKPHTYETSALGAAIDAAVGLRLFPDFKTAVNNMTRVGETYEPIPANREIYHELFEKVYRRLYKRLKPLYNDIRDITDYPPKLC